MNEISLEPEDIAELSPAELCCAPGARVEHGLDVGRRTGYYAQYLASRGLVFEGLLKLALARLLGFKQPRVLDGDHSLAREALEHRDFLVRKGAHLGAQDGETAQRPALAQERHLRHAVDCIELEQIEGVRVFTLGDEPNVVDDDRFPVENSAPTRKLTRQGQRQANKPLHLGARMGGIIEV